MTSNSYKFSDELISYLKDGRQEEAKNYLIGIDRPNKLVDYKGRTLLHYAAKYGDSRMTRYFLDSGFSIDHQDHHGDTPLMRAVRRWEDSTIELLIRYGADIYKKRNNCGQTALQMALKFPFDPIVKLFLYQLRRDYPTNDQLATILHESPDSLHPVVYLRNAEVTRLLLDQGHCPANALYGRGISTLCLAIECCDFDNVKLLVDRGVDVNAIAPSGLRPLDSIPRRNGPRKLEILKLLIDNGAKFERCRGGKERLYGMIFQHGTREMVRLLVQSDRDFVSKNIRNLMLHLTSNGNEGVVEEIKGIEYDVNLWHCEARTPLSFAVEYCHPSGIEFFLSEYANVNFASKAHSHWTALSWVIVFCKLPPKLKIERLKILLEHGADPQHAFYGYIYQSTTPLEEVAARNEQTLAKPLLAYVVLRERILRQPVEPKTRSIIEADRRFERYFQRCIKHVEIMKTTRIQASVALLDLLAKDVEWIANRVKNSNLSSELTRLCRKLCLNKYYSSKLQRRAKEIVNVANVRREAATLFDDIFGHLYHKNHLIVDKIVSFISCHDLQKTLQAKIESS